MLAGIRKRGTEIEMKWEEGGGVLDGHGAGSGSGRWMGKKHD